jgi:hypothetical protein
MVIYYVVVQMIVSINSSLNAVENKWFILKRKNILKLKV